MISTSDIDAKVIVGESYWCQGHCRRVLLEPVSLIVSVINANVITDEFLDYGHFPWVPIDIVHDNLEICDWCTWLLWFDELDTYDLSTWLSWLIYLTLMIDILDNCDWWIVTVRLRLWKLVNCICKLLDLADFYVDCSWGSSIGMKGVLVF